jgi:hypothetical protein
MTSRTHLLSVSYLVFFVKPSIVKFSTCVSEIIIFFFPFFLNFDILYAYS